MSNLVYVMGPIQGNLELATSLIWFVVGWHREHHPDRGADLVFSGDMFSIRQGRGYKINECLMPDGKHPDAIDLSMFEKVQYLRGHAESSIVSDFNRPYLHYTNKSLMDPNQSDWLDSYCAPAGQASVPVHHMKWLETLSTKTKVGPFYIGSTLSLLGSISDIGLDEEEIWNNECMNIDCPLKVIVGCAVTPHPHLRDGVLNISTGVNEIGGALSLAVLDPDNLRVPITGVLCIDKENTMPRQGCFLEVPGMYENAVKSQGGGRDEKFGQVLEWPQGNSLETPHLHSL